MQIILSLIFASYRVHFIFAVLLAAGGFFLQDYEAKRDALRIEIAAQPQPIVQPIEAFSRGKGSPSIEEVHVRAQLVPSQSILLQTKDNNGNVTDESVLYLLYAADAGAEADGETVPLIAQGGVVVPIAQKDMFIGWLMGHYVEGGPLGAIVDLEGLWQNGSSESSARAGMEKYDTETSQHFFYIQPFYDGRAAGVAYAPRDLKAEWITYFYPAFGFLAFAVLKLLWEKRRTKKVTAEPEAANVAMPKVSVQPFVPEPQTPKQVASNDFIGALNARKATPATGVADPVVGRGSLIGRFAGGFKKATAFCCAAWVLYLVTANLGGSFGEPKVIMLTQEPSVQAAPVQVPISSVSDMATRQPMAAVPIAASQVAPVMSQGQAVDWVHLMQVQAMTPLTLAGILMPLWVFMALLVGLALMVAVILGRRATQTGGKRPEIDPFDRLLQRRQAEKAREAQGLLLGGTALRA